MPSFSLLFSATTGCASPSSGSLPSSTVMVFSFPSRRRVSSTSEPGLIEAIRFRKARMLSTSSPFSATMTSCRSSSAFSAGLPSRTPEMRTPFLSGRSRASWISFETGWMLTPIQPRVTLPLRISSS
jgi:hypothetical protein